MFPLLDVFKTFEFILPGVCDCCKDTNKGFT